MKGNGRSLRRRVFLGLIVLVVGAAAWGWWDHVRILTAMGNYLNAPSPSIHAELAFILGGGRSSRADYGAQLFKEGKVERFVLLGAGDLANVDGVVLLNEQQLLDGMLQALGVPPDRIERLPDVCESTEEEVKALKRYLDEHPHKSVVVITNDYHTRRSRWIFDKVFGADANTIQFAGAPTASARPNDWWKSIHGSYTYILEMMKLANDSIR